jgi:peptidase M28-like protein
MLAFHHRAACPGPVAPEPAARALEARLRGWVERLAVPRHARANPRANRRVRDELAAALSAAGYVVGLQGRFGNVVALPRGGAGRPLTLVAAHYDSVPFSPGADDNASGLAALLECARSLAGEVTPAGPVGFVAFNAEEDGLLGSRDFVAEGVRALPGPLRAVHVLEMVGFRGGPGEAQRLPLPWAPKCLRSPDFLGLVAQGPSNKVADAIIARAGSRELSLVAAKTWASLGRLVPDLLRSDHAPFWSAGIPAIMWTDTANLRNPHYHRSSDTPDTLDYAFLREVVGLLGSAVAGERIA